MTVLYIYFLYYILAWSITLTEGYRETEGVQEQGAKGNFWT